MGKKTRAASAPRQDWGPTIHVQSIAHTGVRDFSREPIRRVPDRANRVNAGGALYVSSDVLAWLNKLPPSPPRNAGVKFYPISTNGYDPQGARYAKLLKVQASAMTTLAKLGLVEDLTALESEPAEAVVEPVATEAPVVESTPCAICGAAAIGGYCSVRSCMNHMWTVEELETYPEEYRTLNAPKLPVNPMERIRQNWDRARDNATQGGLEREIRQELGCSHGKALTLANEIRCSWGPVEQSAPRVKREHRARERRTPVANYDVLRRAFCMWIVGRAHLDSSGRDFYVRNRRTGTDDRAPWSTIVRTAYPSQEDFETAARDWQSRNARTIALHS
jgi:hypothetical protein